MPVTRRRRRASRWPALRSNIGLGASFAVETTLAGRVHLRTLGAACAAGMGTRITFCMLPEVTLCLARIAGRVAAGGHAVAEADARRRFVRAPASFTAHAALADHWVILDTQLAEPRLVASGPPRDVADPTLLAALPAALH